MKCKRLNLSAVTKKFNGKPIQARIAPEPSDIFWENLGVPFKVRIKKLLATWLVTIIVLALSFGICFGINLGQKSVYEDYKSSG
jgi:hypothetical protein